MAATKQRERARVDLNSALAAAHARIWQREDKLAAAAAGVLKQAGKIAARQFKKKVQPHLVAAGGPVWTPPPADEVVDVDAIVAALRTKSDPIRQSAIAEYGKALAEANPDVNWDVSNPLVGGVLAGSAQHVTYIADTTRLNVMRTIREAYDQGLSIPDTAKAIQEGMSAASSARGRLIARTELSAVSNGGALAATQLVADATGDTYYKRWMTAPGAPHPRHEDYPGLDGQTVSLNEAFDVGGSPLQFPGDPDGPPEEVCNCVPADTVVELPGLRAAMRRWYQGDLVRIRLASGDELAATPNHPVLRADGRWVPLCEVTEGDNLVRAVLGRQVVGAPDPERPPAEIGEVYRLAEEVFASKRIGVRPVDFHGDGRQGEVDVVPVDREFLLDSDAASDEEVAEFGRTLAAAARSRFCGCEDSRSPTLSRKLHRIRDVVSAGSVGSRSKRPAFARRHPLEPESICLGAGTDWQPEHLQSPSNGCSPYPEGASDCEDALPALVSLTEVVEVDRYPFAGYVYNLDTGDGWYIANSLATRNCRCSLAYVTDPTQAIEDQPVVPTIPVAAGTTLDSVIENMGARELMVDAQHRPDLFEKHPRSGYMVRNDKPAPRVKTRADKSTYGLPPRIEDTVPQIGFDKVVPGSERPPQYLYRAVSEDDWQNSLKRGYIQSDQRMNLADEGTVADFTDPSFYLPGKLASNPDGIYPGRIVRIEYRDQDGWILDHDGYAKTHSPIPVSHVDLVSPRIDTIRKTLRNNVPSIDTKIVQGEKVATISRTTPPQLPSPASFGQVTITGLDGNDAAQLATVIGGNAAAMDTLVSAAMRAVVEPLGGRFEGWQFRLKSEASIARKIETDIGLRAKVPNEIAASGIKDGLRYTVIYQPGEYVAKMTQTLDELRGGGFVPEEVKPYWAKGGPYAGTNLIMHAPNGYRFELQFHTPQSFNVKEYVNHDQYEKWRLVEDKNSPEARALFSQMAGEADKVLRPPGIRDWNYQGSVETTVGITPFREGVDDPIGFYDTEKFKRFENDVRQSADRYGVTLDTEERATGVWQGSEEPAVQLHVHDGVLGVRAFAADVARAYRQDGAALFDGIGDDVIAEFPAGLDHDAVYAAMHEAGLDAGTFTADGRFEAMGTGGDFIKALDTVATRLGVDYDAQLGDFTLLLKDAGDYEKAIGDFGRVEAQQARAAEARTPGGVAGRAAVREGAQGAPGGVGQVAPSALHAPSVAPPSPPRHPPPYTANQLKRLSTDNLYGALAELGKAENAARAEIAAPGQRQVIDELWRRGDQRLPAGTLRYEDVAGDQQAHSVFSDGHHQITEMAEEARLRGETQLVISDHSHLLTSADIDRQHAEIDSLNERYRREGVNFRILKGIEANILSDGTLDAAPEVLARFDVVNGAIHAPQQALGGQQTLFAEANTARLLGAMDNPELNVLVHPHSVAADWDAVARKAHDKGVALEVNGRDLLRNDRQEAAADMIAAAKRHGALLVIGSDAHTTDDLVDLMYALRFSAQHGVTKDDLAPLARRVIRPSDPSASIPASVDLSSPSTERLGGGMNEVFKIENEAGDQYVVKPEPDFDAVAAEHGFSGPLREQITAGNDLGRERAAYIASQYFNAAGGRDFHVNMPAYRIGEINHAPDWVPGPSDGKMKAGISEFIPGEDARSWIDSRGYGGAWPDWFDTDLRREQLRSAGLFDALIGNTDRHSGNFIFGEDDNLWLIDHGLAFPEYDAPDEYGNFLLEEMARNEFRSKLTPREEAFLERLRDRWPQLEADLAEVLDSQEIDEMRSRLDHMIEFRDRYGYPRDDYAPFG